jgi:hypothetical protein
MQIFSHLAELFSKICRHPVLGAVPLPLQILNDSRSDNYDIRISLYILVYSLGRTLYKRGVIYSTALGISCAELEFLIEVCTSAILVCTNICQCVRQNKQNKGVGFPFRIIFLVSWNTIQSETKKLFHEILLVLQNTKTAKFCFVLSKVKFCFVSSTFLVLFVNPNYLC